MIEFTPGEVAVRVSRTGRREFTILVPGCAGHGEGRRARDVPHWHHASGGWDFYGQESPMGTSYEKAVALDPSRERDVQLLSEAMRADPSTPAEMFRALMTPSLTLRCESRIRVLGHSVQCEGDRGHSGDHWSNEARWLAEEVPF